LKQSLKPNHHVHHCDWGNRVYHEDAVLSEPVTADFMRATRTSIFWIYNVETPSVLVFPARKSSISFAALIFLRLQPDGQG
jgi:hypothetical protein